MSGLFAGPLSPERGAEVLLAALQIYPGARIRVLGGHARLRESLGAASYVVLAAADEPAAKTAMAAFSCARPVIAPRLEPLTDLVEPGRNGLLFEPGSARDLARRLAWAEVFPERMRRMGECALADYRSRFAADWAWQSLHGERRRQERVLS